MRAILFVVCSFLLACSASRKIEGVSRKAAPEVHVKDWGFSALSFSSTYWDNVKDSILMQISSEEFEKVKANCGFKKVPSRMSIFDGTNRTKLKEFNERMVGLKVYKIAAYTLVTRLKETGTLYERYNILRCPYEVNKDWHSATTWDTVYFVVHEEAVEPVKG